MAPVSTSVLTCALAATQAFSLQVEKHSTGDPKPPDEAFDRDYPARGDVVRPRMVTMLGCSGSSAVMLFARHLLRFHGIPVPSAEGPHQDADGNAAPPRSYGWPDELLKENVNWWYKRAGEDWGKAMGMAYEDVLSQNQTMFFKGMVDEIADDEIWFKVKPYFQDMHIHVVLGYRHNMLDQIICEVNDCFHPEYGVPVDGTGERSNLCFHRRDEEGKSMNAQTKPKTPENRALAEHHDKHIETQELADELLKEGNRMQFLLKTDYKAQIDAQKLIESIEIEYAQIKKARYRLHDAGFHFKEVTAEDLLDFEADPEALERAVDGYADLLVSFGVNVNKAIVRQYLQQFVNTYPKAAKHSDLIYNFDEVKSVLAGTKYEQFIRQ